MRIKLVKFSQNTYKKTVLNNKTRVVDNRIVGAEGNSRLWRL